MLSITAISRRTSVRKKIIADSREPHRDHQPFAPRSIEQTRYSWMEVSKHHIGYVAVDLRGQPIVNKSKTGTWKAAGFIFVTEVVERMSFYGLIINAVAYLVYHMHQSFPTSSDIVVNVAGAVHLTPLLGAFVADAYLGRYRTILLFTVIYIVGLVLLFLSASLESLTPRHANCEMADAVLGKCEEASTSQMGLLYAALYTVALGSGGIKPCVSAFGADQFDPEEPEEAKHLPSFFNAFYFCITVGVVLALSVIITVEDRVGFDWGFGVVLASMVLAALIFLMGTPRYRHKLPSGSPLTRIIQVLVASLRKSFLKVPEDEFSLYEVYDKESAIVGSRKIVHTFKYRCLDKAATQTSEEREETMKGGSVSAWKLCTVTQVEEVKILLAMFPIWASGIILNMAFIQINNFALQSGSTMDRKLGPHLELSVPTFAIASTILISISLPLYEMLFVPFMRKRTGHPRGITMLQRQGAGLVIMTMGVITAAIIENRRRALAWKLGLQEDPLSQLPISAFWLSLVFVFVGAGEVFASVGQLEFFYDQVPDGMRSIGVALFTANGGVGAYAGTICVRVLNRILGEDAWISVNINLGHMDYYYVFIAILSVLNFIAFLFFSSRYRYRVAPFSTKRHQILQLPGPAVVPT